MNNIIMYGHSGSGNHGCEAIIRSTQKLLERKCLIYSNSIEQDIKYGIKKSGLRQYSNYIPQNSIRRYFFAVHSRLFKQSMLRYKYMYRPFLEKIEAGKVYLSVGGDHYCYGSYSNHIYDFLNESVVKKGGKSVLWSCSIEEKDLDEQTIESLKKYTLITARESITYETLIEKGVQKNVILVPDVAFQLDAERTKLPEGFIKGNTIGINISPMVQKYGINEELVLNNYGHMIEYILEETNCSIALIPHVVWSDIDDRIPLRKLYNKYKDSGRVVLIEDMPAEKLKWVISQCCFFVGARTHATIAAYSSCVPKLVVGYSVKARGIAKDIFGTEEGYVIPVQELKNEDVMMNAFEKLWSRREEIGKYLEKFIPGYCRKVLNAKKMIEDICNM